MFFIYIPLSISLCLSLSLSVALIFDHMMDKSIAIIYDKFKYNTGVDW
jgi:hypothetical protein